MRLLAAGVGMVDWSLRSTVNYRPSDRRSRLVVRVIVNMIRSSAMPAWVTPDHSADVQVDPGRP